MLERYDNTRITTTGLARPDLTNILHDSSEHSSLSTRPQPQAQIILQPLHSGDREPERILQIRELRQIDQR
jgi:hypothetical protein